MRMHTMTAPRSCGHLQCTRMDNGDDAGAVTLGIRQASGMSHPMSNFTSSMGVRETRTARAIPRAQRESLGPAGVLLRSRNAAAISHAVVIIIIIPAIA
jgi:hypothetical protein